MRHCWIAVGLCLLCSPACAAEAPAVSPAAIPHWISTSPPRSHPVDLMRWFKAEAPIQQATLKFAADFCFATVAINETEMLEVAPFVQLQTLDVTNAVQRGENRLRVRLRDGNELSGVALSLEVRYVDGTSAMVVSDGTWSVGLVDPTGVLKVPPLETEKHLLEDRGAVAPELWGIGRRDISLSAFENYEQWQQSKGEVADKHRPKFWLAPGFEITELRVAQPDEGSWIAMAFDPQGRLTVSREDVGLLRMTLAEDRKSVARVEKIDVKLEECRGLAYDGETLYANANNSKGLYRLKIDNTGAAQGLELIRQFPGGVGHGRNDIALLKHTSGPPSIYSIHGDSVDLPTSDLNDLTSPLRETKLLPPKREGTLYRLDLGEPLKTSLVHAGLRNPYGVALHQSGDPFTFDADNEHDMGTPWYRPTRILQLVTGGDSGYREVTGQLPPRFHDQPDHAPPLFDIGRSSPTSVMFGYGLKFPTPYQRALFALDWTYGRVIAVHLFPRGMTYRASAETFLQGRPLNVTDITTGPDGAMYLITGGRKTQSALFRIISTNEPHEFTSRPSSQHEELSQEYSGMIRSKKTLTSMSNSSLPREMLSHDSVERHSARLVVERDPKNLETGNSRTIAPGPGAMTALMVIARARKPEAVRSILSMLLNIEVHGQNIPIATHDLTSQFIWTRVANLCLEISRDQVLMQREKLIPDVVAVWKALDTRPFSVAPEGTSVELRRRLAYLLGELGADELPALVGPVLLASGVQEDQLAGLLALRNQKTGWTPALRRQQFETINSIPLMIGGAGLPPLEKWLREESIKTLSEAERTELAGLLEPKPPVPEPLPPARPLVKKWTPEDLASLHGNENPKGDAERGRLLFREALCARCHRVGLRGAAVGPDLTFVSRRFSRKDVLESVLLPSKSVAENYRLETITTLSGQTHTGRIIPEGDYRSEKVRLSLDPLDASKVVEIDKKEIDQHNTSPVSPMPSGLLDTLTLDEVRDLLAYLESGGAGR